MKEKELYEKVQLLKAGQAVEIEGDWFRAVRLKEDMPFGLCNECGLDSICRGDVLEICCEMESVGSHVWMLKLAHP